MKINFHLDKKNKPQHESGMKVVYGHAKRGGYRLRWYLILAIVISPVVVMSYYLFRSQVLITAPGIITSHPLVITAKEAGIIAPLPINVGEKIKAEQSLLLMNDNILAKEVDFLEGELAQLEEHLEQDRSSEAIYQRAISTTQSDVNKVGKILNKYETYRAKGQVSEVDYAAVVNVNNALNNQLSGQRIAYIESQRRLKELELAGAITQQYRSLKKELVAKKAQQDNLNIRAPYDGRVIDIHVREGQRVSENYPLVTISKNVTPDITAFLDPKHLKYGEIGVSADVKFPDGKVYAATVYSPVEVVNKLPSELQKPFEGQPAYLKVTLSFDEPIETERWIEGVEVEVIF